jgi:hypothetical protein
MNFCITYRVPPAVRSVLAMCVICTAALCVSAGSAHQAFASQAGRSVAISTGTAVSPFVLACPGPSLCVAADHGGNIIQWTRLSSGTVGSGSLQAIDPGNPITGIACPSMALCVAVDAAGNILTSNDPAGPSSSWQTTHLANSTFTGVSCPSTRLCVASAMGGNIAASDNPGAGGSTWSVSQIDPSETYECFHYGGAGANCAASLVAVACGSVTYCVAVDDAGNVLSSSNPTEGPSGWSGNTSGSLPEDESYNGVACPSSGSCFLTDSYSGDIATLRGSAGFPAVAAHLFAGQAAGLACQSASFCVAYDNSGSLFDSNAPTSSAAAWASAATPAGTEAITAASCPPSSSSCFAIDENGQLLDASTGSPEGESATTHRTRALAFRVVARVRLRRSRRPPPRLLSPAGPRVVLIKAKHGADGSAVTVARFEPRSDPLEFSPGASGHRLESLPKHSLRPSPVAVAASASTAYGSADATSACAPNDWYVDSSNHERCSLWSYGFASYYPNGFTYFTALKNELPLTYVRFFVPYDAVEYWDTQTQSCTFSAALTTATTNRIAGQEWWTLYNEIQDAEAIGLTPVVSLTAATGVQPPAGTQTGSSTGGLPQYPLVNTYNTDAYDYQCGVEGIVQATQSNSVPVSNWEPWNEPDAACQYNNGHQSCNQTGGSCSGTSGADQAAGLYYNFYSSDYFYEGRHNDNILAGVFTHPSVGYFNDYACYLNTKLYVPPIWSYHDYTDVGSYQAVGSAPLAYSFDSNLWTFCHKSTACSAQPNVWITEAAADTTSSSTTFSNGASTSGCNNGDNDNGGQLGACIDGNTTYQNAAGNGFLNLASQGSYFTGQIAQVYWYQFQPANASSGFDSGLLSAPAPYSGQLPCPQGGYNSTCYYASPDGNYSEPRKSYCILTRGYLSTCGSSSTALDAEDWSTQPGPPNN